MIEAVEPREYSIEEIMRWDDPSWLIEEFVEEGSCIFISAQPKVGKSFFALRIGAAVSSGSKLFGYSARQGDVLYLAAERASLMKRRIKALQERGIGIDSQRFKVWPRAVIFSNHEEVRIFARSLKVIPDLLIVDTLRRCNDGDERDNNHMSEWTAGVELFRDLTGASVIVIHHDHRESYSSYGRKLESSFSGAGAILGNFDGYFSLRPQANGTIVINSEGSNELTEFHATVCIQSVELESGRSTGVMVEVDSGGVVGPQPSLAELALGVLRNNPGITMKEWHRLCKIDDRINGRWPTLSKGTLSRIKSDHRSMIVEEVNLGHKQQPFLKVLEAS